MCIIAELCTITTDANPSHSTSSNLPPFTATPLREAITLMITLGFFFLLLPREYAVSSQLGLTPFHLCDVDLYRHQYHINHLTCPLDDLQEATFVGPEFTNQKNGVQGKVVRLGCSGSPMWCSIITLICHITHLFSLMPNHQCHLMP
jgi:hypothetical protein